MADHATNLARLSRFIASVRELNPQLPAQTLSVLLVVARKPGVTPQELARATSLNTSSISRNIGALSGGMWGGKPGLGLVAQVPDPRDPRGTGIYLTTKGRDTVRRLVEVATGEPMTDFNPRVVR